MAANPQRTRYHEAGHAVIGVLGGWHCSSVVVAGMRPEFSGGSTFNPLEVPLAIGVPVAGPCADLIRSRLCLKVAGEMAALKLTGVRWRDGCYDDYHGSPGEPGAIALAEWLTSGSDPEARDALIADMEAEVTARFDDPRVWRMVTALAEELETTPQMFGPQMEAFFAGHGVSMPRFQVVRLPA